MRNGKCYQHLPFLKTQVLIIATQLKTLNHCKSMKFISHTRHYMPNVNLKKTYNIMRLSVVLCMLSLFCASAKTGYSQVAEISLNLHNVTISEALEEIKHQSEYSFWYKNDEINLNEKVSVKADRQSIKQILRGILDKQG